MLYGNRLMLAKRPPKQLRGGRISACGAGFDTQVITARAGSGGIGLISVPERLEMIGGSIKIDSLPGDGTTIAFSAPALKADNAPALGRA